MPAPVLKKLAKKHGVSLPKAESYWNKAKSIARKDGRKESDKDFYPYVVGIFKRMIGEKPGDKKKKKKAKTEAASFTGEFYLEFAQNILEEIDKEKMDEEPEEKRGEIIYNYTDGKQYNTKNGELTGPQGWDKSKAGKK